MFRNFFLPHPETHKKAYLLSWKALIVYTLLFILFETSLTTLNTLSPGVLGIASGVNQQEIIALTNQERQKMGLEPLVEDERLNAAAAAKAQNMFEENYWAHYSPSGRDPWGFILASGYKFSYAGENLARNFYTSPDIVNAWMNSPSHKENIINPKYKNIGIAVAEGQLKGEKTVLVVQEFGTPTDVLVTEIPQKPNNELALAQNDETNVLSAPESFSSASFFTDKYFLLKTGGMLIIAFIGGLLVADIYVLRRRQVFHISPNHLSHLALLALASGSLLKMSPGSIL